MRVAVLAVLSASMLSSQTPGDTVQYEASLQGHAFALRERVGIRFTAANHSPRPIVLPDPSRGSALTVRLRSRGGEKTFSIGEVASAPGVPPTRAEWRLPSNDRRTFEFDLAALARISDAGDYSATLEFAAPGSPPWRSAEIRFTITPAAGAFLEAFESEASRRGAYAVLWTEREGTDARALLYAHNSVGEGQNVWGASAVARVPTAAQPALSVSPPGQDFPDRWMVWIDGPQLRYLYLARDPASALKPAALPIPANARLVRTPLADAPPATGRPTCHVAWLSGASLQRAVIEGSGRVRQLPPIALEGEAESAWAVSVRPGEHTYVVALRSGNEAQVMFIRCRGEKCAVPAAAAFKMPGRVEAGDIGVVGNDALAAFVFSRPEGRTRVTLRLSPNSAPQTAPLPSQPGVDRTVVRVDASGAAHVVLANNRELLYFRPGSNAPSRVPRHGPLFDLMTSEQPLLITYDQHGPALMALPATGSSR